MAVVTAGTVTPTWQVCDLSQRGASAVEYALLVGFIAAVIVTGIAAFGGNVSDLFTIDLTGGP